MPFEYDEYHGQNYLYDNVLLEAGVLSMEEFDFSDYHNGEINCLQPQLEALGFTINAWYTGEGDSFGPLTRCARLTDENGQTVIFVYG